MQQGAKSTSYVYSNQVPGNILYDPKRLVFTVKNRNILSLFTQLRCWGVGGSGMCPSIADDMTSSNVSVPETPCLYDVSVLADGIGDLYHYFDFIEQISERELQNAIFVIDTNREAKAHQNIVDICNALPQDHPLKKQKVYIFSSAMKDERLDQIIASLSKPMSRYYVSYNVPNSSFNTYLDEDFVSTGYLGEHYKDTDRSLTAFSSRMSLGNGPGIFISVNSKQFDENNKFIQKLGLSKDSNLVLCYAHTNTEFQIQQLCELHIAQHQDRRPSKLTIFLPKGIPERLTVKTRILLREAACELRDCEGEWVIDKDFEQLKALECKNAIFSTASGDKMTENCFSNGLFPVISFVNHKEDFWSSVIDTLKEIKEHHIESDHDKERIDRIISYVEKSSTLYVEHRSIDWNPEHQAKEYKDSLLKATKALDNKCFELWSKVVRPYVRKNYNIKDKVAENIKRFRMLSELLYNPVSAYAKDAKKFFLDMQDKDYEQLITALLNKHASLYDKDQKDTHLRFARLLLSIRDCNSLSEEVHSYYKLTVAKMNMSHIPVDTLFRNPSVYTYLGWCTQVDKSDLAMVFKEHYSASQLIARESIKDGYMKLLEALERSSSRMNINDIINFLNTILIIYPERTDGVLDKATKLLEPFKTQKQSTGILKFSEDTSSKYPQLIGDKFAFGQTTPTVLFYLNKTKEGSLQEVWILYGQNMALEQDGSFMDNVAPRQMEIHRCINMLASKLPYLQIECNRDERALFIKLAPIEGNSLKEYTKSGVEHDVKQKIVDAAIKAYKELLESGVSLGNIKANNLMIHEDGIGRISLRFTCFHNICESDNYSLERDAGDFVKALDSCLKLTISEKTFFASQLDSLRPRAYNRT